VKPPAAAGAAGASGGGAGAGAAGEAGGAESVCSSCVNPPAAAGVELADGIGASGTGSLGFAGASWFNACINWVNPPLAAGVDSTGRAGVSLNGNAGSGECGLNGSADGAGAVLENMLVNEPGAELRGGSAWAGADGVAPSEAPV
jgi:hypothetical protein